MQTQRHILGRILANWLNAPSESYIKYFPDIPNLLLQNILIAELTK